jgi:gliding motility-associated-like protein
LKHTDDYIKDIFSQRLGEYESAVRPELWNNIASQLPAGSAATGGAAGSAGNTASVATKAISAKLIWAAAIAAITAVTVVTYVALKDEEVATSTPTTVVEPAQKTEQSTPASTENTTTIGSETEANSPIANTNKQPITTAAATGTPTTAAQTHNGTPSLPAQQDVANYTPVNPSGSATPAPPEVVVAQAPTTQQSTGSVQNAPIKEEKLTAQFSTARVSKDELHFFFMPQFTHGESYHWDFGDGTSVTDLSPMHRYDDEGVHRVVLTVTDAKGKKERHTFDVVAYLPAVVDVPNIFTPNGDGLNDTFDVLEKSRNITLTKTVVFSNDRLVFEADDERLWDGNDQQGNPLPQGEYKFFITAIDKEGHKVEKKGFVTLRR